jgi:diaminopimelate epimerase
MLRRVKFTKMHGCGNDYVFVYTGGRALPGAGRLARRIADRHRGVGSDGLILIDPAAGGDFAMRMFNADGSEGEMCGNGIRCIGKYVYDHGLTRRRDVSVRTRGGTVRLRLHVRGGAVRRVTVDMGAPRPVPPAFFRFADGRARLVRRALRLEGRTLMLHVLSMGNPHCVLFVPDVERAPVETLGPTIERHPWFPRRTNVEFVQVDGPRAIRQRTWERGSGETLCCGSGACAAAAAAYGTGRTGPAVVNRLRGGTLSLRIGRDGSIRMTGPAAEICSGEWPNAER